MDLQVRLFGQNGSTTSADGEQAQNTPYTPLPLLRQRDWVFQHVAVWMRTYGMRYMQLEAQAVGSFPATNVSFQPLDDENIPDTLRYVRPDIIRMLKLIFERYCISSFGITLSEEELQELRTYWRYLQDGDPQAAEDLRYNRVPLQFDQDPKPTEAVQLDGDNTQIQAEEGALQAPEFESNDQQ